jgi:hypothetical protein
VKLVGITKVLSSAASGRSNVDAIVVVVAVVVAVDVVVPLLNLLPPRCYQRLRPHNTCCFNPQQALFSVCVCVCVES